MGDTVLVVRHIRKNHLEELGLYGRIILKMGLQEVIWGGMEWFILAKNTDSWRTLTKAVMNFRVP